MIKKYFDVLMQSRWVVGHEACNNNCKELVSYLRNKDLEPIEVNYILEWLETKYYLALSDYVIFFELLKAIIRKNVWNYRLCEIFREYLRLNGWDYEEKLVGILMEQGDLESIKRFCMEHVFATETESYFLDKLKWRDIDFTKLK